MQLVHRVILSALLHQLVVIAAFRDPAAIEHENLVGRADRRQPVGDDERRASPFQHVEGALDDRFRLGIDARRRFVQDQDRRIEGQRPRERDQLALTRGQRAALLDDRLIQAARQLHEHLVRADIPQRLLHFSPAKSTDRRG